MTDQAIRLGKPTAPKKLTHAVSLVEEHSAGRSAGFLLWHASLRWQRRIAEVLSPMDLTHVQFAVLATVWWLGKDGQPPRQREVAEHGGIDPGMTSQVMATLLQKHWVARRADPDDKRAFRLYVTAAGKQIAERAVGELDRAEREFFRAAGGRDAVLKVLRALAGRDERGRLVSR